MTYNLSTRISWDQTVRDLKATFTKWGIGFQDWDISKPLRYGSEVTVTYKKNGRTIVLKYDKQMDAKSNLRAIYLALEDMRMIEVRGISDLVESAYKQIGSGDHTEHNLDMIDPYQILEISPTSSIEVAEAVYRTMARKYHPDAGVSANPEKFKQVTEAIEVIRNEKKA